MERASRDPEGLLARIAAALAPMGLNLVGAASVADYDQGLSAGRSLGRLLPGARGAIVIGGGGRTFWTALRVYCAGPPAVASADPVDRFTEHLVERTLSPLVAAWPTRFLYPHRFEAEPVSFMRLAAAAGLGRPSLLGVLVHPTFGPWMALRAAILLPFEVAAPRPADGFDPCPSCVERPCIPACPAGAVTAAGWDIPRCGAARLADDPCAARCHARVECVLGREHRYGDEALAHHQRAACPSLAAFLGRT